MFANRDSIGYDGGMDRVPTTECKHGLKHGCVYCHVTRPAAASTATPPRKKTRGSSLSEKMNDRMTALKRRLREIRGE